MATKRFYFRNPLVYIVFSLIITGCCCKKYDDPYSLPNPTPGSSSVGVLHAGVAKIDVTPVDGVPLAGYGGRRKKFPDINPFNMHTYYKPSKGILDHNYPLYARSLVLDNGNERICIVTFDGCASDGDVMELAHRKASAQGFSIPFVKVLFCASHTHSGPGAMTNKLLLVYGAADLCVDEVRDALTSKIAESMVKAEQSMDPVLIGITTTQLTGVTKNRRADLSNDIHESHIDDQLGIISIDKKDGTRLATVWNYAIHGTSHRDSNLKFSPDNVGEISSFVEQNAGGIALFINGAEGDSKPKGDIALIRATLGGAIISKRPQATIDWLELKTAHKTVSFGTPQLDISLHRILSINHGEFDFQDVLKKIKKYTGVKPTAGMIIPLNSKWLENEFRFQAIRIGKTLLVSVPGEPIYDIGLAIRNDALAIGYDKVFICALANNHMGYVTTEKQYNIGGYESFFTMFGPKTGEKVTKSCGKVANAIKH